MSPAIAEFVQQAVVEPLHKLPLKLASFPRQWPLPRGDLYHWIPLLDRFDHILEAFNKEYGLREGPQAQPFERRLLEKGDAEENMPYPSGGAQKQELDGLGYSEEGDRELIEKVVSFTRLLLEHCGNRSLYASSGHINDLLHTTSMSLLRACLKLGLRLAQRYQVARYKNNQPQMQAALLANHYNFNLDNLHKIALPFPKPSSGPASQATPTPSKGKEKAAAATSTYNPSDLVAFAKEGLPASVKKDLSNVTVTYYDQSAAGSKATTGQQPSEPAPVTPTPVRRTSTLGPSRDRPSAGDRSASTNDVSDTPVKSRETDAANAPKTYQIPASDVASTPAWQLVRDSLPSVPRESQYDLLNRIRIAKGFASDQHPDQTLLESRLLAIANLAYAVGESKFQEKLGLADAEEPRRFHLAQQLCDLLQPSAHAPYPISLDMEIVILQTLEALVRLKHKWSEVTEALSITVNHGVLYYELRKVISSLHLDEHEDVELELKETEWRQATLTLVDTVSQANPQAKYAERMLGAGVMDIEIEVLTLRTSRAERFHEKVLGFLDAYIHNIASSFQTLTTLKGLDILTDLASYEVSTSLQMVKEGKGMPDNYKSKVVDYEIPYYKQATLRSLFKFIIHLFDHNSGVHDRELRNLLDSSTMLGALRTVIDNAGVFGSNVWSAATNTVTNFIHNEPTSFQVIAEAGLAKAILEAVTQTTLPDPPQSEAEPRFSMDAEPVPVVDGEIQHPEVNGILPVGETIVDIPNSFGAICLNESGMKLFQASGAMDKFFDIFVSPAHVRALEDDGMTAATVGNAFDELSRHHPQLKEQILSAVIKMVKRVRSVTRAFSEQAGVGAKLWTISPGSGEVEVAGGRAAVAGKAPTVGTDSTSVTAVELGEDMISERAKATPYLSACFKFLDGFFHNSSMCQAFSINGGGEIVLDLATSPSNPHDVVAFSVYNKMATVVKRMCDEKPHLILPSLLARTQAALKELRPLIDASNTQSYFYYFTQLNDPSSAGNHPEGTSVIKSLTLAHILSHMLGRALAPQSQHAHRHSGLNQNFISLSFTDVYVQLVDDFSKLHSACLWENIALKDNLPEKWKSHVDPKPFSQRRINSDGVVEFPPDQRLGNAEGGNKGPTAADIGDGKTDLYGFKNTRAIRYLLSQAPMGIEAFFQSLGQVLAPKRTNDVNVKLHAGLVAEHLAKSAMDELDARNLGQVSEAQEHKYVSQVLHTVTRMLLRSSPSVETFGSKEAITLVLHKFYLAGGFEKLQAYLQSFSAVLARDGERDESVDLACREGLSTILSFYAQVVRPKCIIEASQSGTIQVRGFEHADYFIPSQFLVELRKTVLDTVTELWQSDAIVKVGDQNVKSVIDILKHVLKAEGEDKALRRSDNATRRVAATKPDFSLKNASNLQKVKDAGHAEDLAKEAIYRCNNQELNATEYAALRTTHNAPRFGIPQGSETPAPLQRQTSVEMQDAGEAAGPSSQNEVDAAPSSDADMSEDAELGGLGPIHASIGERDLQAMAGGGRLAELSRFVGGMGGPANDGQSAKPPAEDTKKPFITVDDLNETRDQVKEDLVDRCLEVLSSQPNITFELAELIQAAVAKSGEGANPRADIGNTLVSSLLSLQGDESPEIGVKVSSYAHLVALILQDRDFFDSTLDELKDNFEAFIGWIQIRQDQKAEDAPWIEMLLLIVERVLAEDEQPIEVEWTPPPADNPLKPLPEPKIPEPVVPMEARIQLFDALVDILLKVQKNPSLALSITRVFVLLTRRRDLATRLSDKWRLDKLFKMIKQLAGPVGEKLQSSFLLVLRHMVEDEQTIRQIMKTEIRASFEAHRSMRAIDTTTYVRNMHHLVLRDPQMFVSVTQELLEIPRFDGHPQRAQQLSLKPAPQPEKKDEAAAEATSAITGEGSNAQPAKPDAKPDVKPPTSEGSDGIVAFLLRELSTYREVEDTPMLQKKDSQPGASNEIPAPGSGDVEMSDATAPNGQTPENKKAEKPAFKAEDHSIYIYRCFILQCLSELLACYSRTKVEFINFSRKSESQPATPSKPRAGTLLYLLNTLLPIGTLEHRDDTAHRKKQTTSNWATLVLVALCSITQEKYAPRSLAASQAQPDEDNDLTFVRRFVLEHAIRSFKDVTTSHEPLDQRYSRLMALADLFDRMLSMKSDRNSPISTPGFDKSQQQLGRLMYEKNLIAALTTSIAELDLNFPNAKRAVKHILVPLKNLTDLAVHLSQREELSGAPGSSTEEEDFPSETSASEADSADEEREQTPDLFRNSALGIYNADHEESDDEDDDEDDDMEDYEEYDDEEEMDFEEDQPGDPGEVVSDEDEDIEGMEGQEDMGDIEGLPGDVDMEVEIMDGEDDDEDDDEDEDEEDGDEGSFGDMEEITGDNENGSMADDVEEADWEDEADDFDGDEGGSPHGGPLDHIAQVLGGDLDSEGQDNVIHVDMTGGGDEEYFEDEMPPADEDDEEDEDEMDYDGDVVYEPEHEDEELDDMGWEWDAGPPRGHHHHHHRGGMNGFMDFVGGPMDPYNGRGPFYRNRGNSNARGDDEGTNPLLQRDSAGQGFEPQNAGGLPPVLSRYGGGGGGRQAIIGDLVAAMNRADGGGISLNVDPRMMGSQFGGMPPIFAINGRGGAQFLDIDPRRPWREQVGFGAGGQSRDSRGNAMTEEAAAVDFRPVLTSVRWTEEARMLFGGKHHDKATRIIHSLLRLLVPPAMEAKRIKDKEDAERKAAEEKAREEERQKAEAERKEREERERKEREEREAKEAEEAAARAHEQAETAAAEGDTATMEGVEQEQSQPTGETAAEPEPPRERITINMRGRELDITDLGIDRDYIEALPEDMREEVIMSQVNERSTQARQRNEPPSEISREFLDALPPDIQAEILASEARDRRAREHAEARRQRSAQAGNAQAPQPQEMDQADFFATLDPALRQQVLMEQDENVLELLPEEFQRQARQLIGDRPRHRGLVGRPGEAGARIINVGGNMVPGGPRHEVNAERPRVRPVVQMLDKPGVATLLRLMFVSLHHRAKSSLHGILSDVCKNTQNRAEVISILLSILQDGTADIGAVERSFAQLSLRAKQLAGQKTPQPLKRTLTGQAVAPTTELSPLNIVQQVLGTLHALSSDNPKVPTFFLSEHETITSQKIKTGKKGKGKESKAAKYPINALLTLLDRKLITENTGVMETLAALLSRVTQPLVLLLKKAKEAEAAEKAKAEKKDETAEKPGEGDTAMQEAFEEAAQSTEQGSTNEPDDKQKDESQAEQKKKRELEPPEVPEDNIRLVINILACRELTSKTFSDTLDIIKHLTAIPGAKEIFGKELIRQAQELGRSIVGDLEDLAKQIGTAKTGVDLQGMALAKFSSSGSQQRKLLQVLIALDHLFDPKRMQGSTSTSGTVDPKLKEDILATLSESATFEKLWRNLSLCLAAIRRRGNMVNVATILLPLIESLFVVCRNSALKEAASTTNTTAEVTVGTPPPDTSMEGLFFNFTEEHRKILNELIRNNPKLMNGNLSILAKNSKVLEFDNKRNYFNRKLHSRGADRAVPHPSLTLNVRREHVFMDSYKALFYKSGEEIKNGKLNIRFNGEEGIDAGGVSREWFGVMARQMFNPDYALFNPVASDRTTFHPNSLSDVNTEHLAFFKFIGRIIAKALYEGRVLDCHFSRAVYRRILGKSVSLKDMETLDLDYYRSLVWILENDITDVTFETFSVDVDKFGVTETVDLVPDGRNIPVTEANKQEYVRLVVEHRLIKSVQEQLDAFLGGFQDVIPQDLIAIFNEQELELLISGLPDIDVDDWKNNTEYHNYQATSPQIQWFWRAVKSFDSEEKAKLLQFVTGTSKVPLNGFKELEGMNGFAKFNIHRDYSSKDKLPTSHTCFNRKLFQPLVKPQSNANPSIQSSIFLSTKAMSSFVNKCTLPSLPAASTSALRKSLSVH